MDAIEQLGVIAEIAAVFAGFIAIFIAFIGRDGRFAAADAHFIQAMVLSTMYTIAFALLPPVLLLLARGDAIWFEASLAAFLVSVPIGIYQTWMQVRMPGEESQKISLWWHVPGWALAGATALAYLGACFAWADPEGLYLAGNTLSLAIGIWCFVAIVFRKFF